MGTISQLSFNYNNFNTPTVVENCQKSIEPLTGSYRINRISKRNVNINNLISIPKSDSHSYPPKSHVKHFVPAFLLSNVMWPVFLAPKIDDVRAVPQITFPRLHLHYRNTAPK